MSAPAHTTLVVATPAQKRTIWRNMWKQWEQPKGVSWDECAAYYAKGDALDACRDGRATYWALVNRSDPEHEDVLASTRTIRRDAKTLKDGQARDVTSYVITAVVTPPHHRSTPRRPCQKGYATHMLSLLHYALSLPSPSLPPFPTAEFGQPPAPHYSPRNATFATLWSDVGRAFYRAIRIGGHGERSREGWVVRADQEVRCELPPPLQEESAAHASALPRGWQSVSSVSEIPSDLLTTLSLHTLTAVSHHPTKSGKTLAFDAPTSPGIIDYSIARSARFTPRDVLERNGGQIHHVYINETTTPPSLAILVPTYTPKEPATLKISYLSLPLPASETTTPHVVALHKDLIALLYSRARAYSCSHIEGWELPQPLIDAWRVWAEQHKGTTLVVHTREEHLGALVWYGDGEQGPSEKEEVVMLGGQLCVFSFLCLLFCYASDGRLRGANSLFLGAE
ncbi:hypothetical protein QFC19_008179 [Naganishia cerealis]|uniref:Uncharacterized protein n=1 Tax=Naganishia cerealis TaxID=610337 RepID=A0ACC2V3G9_9TREE|nr:hypothetical protein QFC19_008179 [Naganishia cerealis]